MKPLPLPVRVAAGLAVAAVDQARHLPEKLAELPVTVVSQALQLSMRVQQQMTELAIKGDDALATFRPVEETPEWATFDEDKIGEGYDATPSRPASTNGRSRFETVEADDTPDDVSADVITDVLPGVDADGVDTDPWTAEEQALANKQVEEPLDMPPPALPDYDQLTLPQVRARMRRLSVAELNQLVEYERAHANRPAVVGMLDRRIATVRDQR